MSIQLPPASDLPALPESTLNDILDLLFEPSTSLHALVTAHRSSILSPTSASSPSAAQPTSATPQQPSLTYPTLISNIRHHLLQTLRTSSSTTSTASLNDILAAHPRLGEKKVDSAMSRLEQAAMNSATTTTADAVGRDDGKEAEAARLAKLNADYEARFPGLRYVVFVNGRPRTVIMQDMEARITEGDITKERERAIEAMYDIALDRVNKLQAAAG